MTGLAEVNVGVVRPLPCALDEIPAAACCSTEDRVLLVVVAEGEGTEDAALAEYGVVTGNVDDPVDCYEYLAVS